MIDTVKKFKIWIITIFPEYFRPLLDCGVTANALNGPNGLALEVNLVPLGNYTFQKYKGIDDTPFGGGPGMIVRADVLKNALDCGVVNAGNYGGSYRDKLHIVYTSPRGKVWNRDYCKEFSGRVWTENASRDLVFICGRYEGVDERFLQKYVDEEISIGDYVLTGGEIAVMAILDSALRYLPGVLGNRESSQKDSFEDYLLENGQYTKPREFEGVVVPEVLLSGNHKKIAEYHLAEKLALTKQYRPDLFLKFNKLSGKATQKVGNKSGKD
ncbi:MAG TPA: tRNA (guanosine(37)-N1)-methyltransferase TrmD [Bacteriovoracaceae bacterium]|nr:tRNA (guanosine(37)-N1)-methyltransferase TrmD [Bacteriovoracaceae bacterium]